MTRPEDEWAAWDFHDMRLKSGLADKSVTRPTRLSNIPVQGELGGVRMPLLKHTYQKIETFIGIAGRIIGGHLGPLLHAHSLF